ncbi:LacI family DNA-binding transcriptional regulator [Sporanaerobium hydrogeniformans]|uniref:LacI family DNA-binding transcriptional regulator n=1 Tax=Sporanaerobium hydrogeniformans TaxID=3072179 RepID=UPI0015D4B7AC|nr:substrate-binding domain-containing protein [Sporanaerobium hydrogeniformans]
MREKDKTLGKKRITIKDIAEQVGVSYGTVHRALYGKKGVGEELRNKILRTAAESGYIPNEAAAALKRKMQRILVAIPGPHAQNRFFYSHVWQGFRDYANEFGNYNFDIIEIPYYNVSGNRVEEELASAYRHYEGDIDGIIVAGPLSEAAHAALRTFAKKDIAIVMITDKSSDALASVLANYEVTGRLAAELLTGQLSQGDKVLVLAGDMQVPNHSLVTQGFADYLEEHKTGIECVYIYAYGDKHIAQIETRIIELLKEDSSIRAAFSVNARCSVILSEVIRRQGYAGKLKVVGSDVFEENVQSMKDGVMQNIICKHPYEQAYQATKIMFEYLIRGVVPVQRTHYVESNVIFNSNLSMYLK